MDNNQSDLTEQTLPGAETNVPASGGETAAEQSLSLADLEATLGKKFPTKEAALKAVKDTFNYVGAKVAANPAPAQDASTQEQLKALQEQVFYATNPQFKGHENIIKAMGSNPAEVVNTEAFKAYMEKATVADKVQQTKSVVASNSRLGAPKTVTDEALNVANAAGSSTSDVANVFAKSLADALGGN